MPRPCLCSRTMRKGTPKSASREAEVLAPRVANNDPPLVPHNFRRLVDAGHLTDQEESLARVASMPPHPHCGPPLVKFTLPPCRPATLPVLMMVPARWRFMSGAACFRPRKTPFTSTSKVAARGREARRILTRGIGGSLNTFVNTRRTGYSRGRSRGQNGSGLCGVLLARAADVQSHAAVLQAHNRASSAAALDHTSDPR